LSGLVTLAAIKRVPTDARATTRVRDIMCPLDQVPTAAPDESLVALLGRLQGCSDGRALVLGPGGSLVGIVSPSDVSRLMQLSSAGRGGPVSAAGVRSP
jgi:CBS domain-containing protein